MTYCQFEFGSIGNDTTSGIKFVANESLNETSKAMLLLYFVHIICLYVHGNFGS